MSSPEPEGSQAVVLAACTLVPIRLATVLLWLAESGLFELLWSDQILDEVRRNLPRLGVSEEKAAHRVSTMRKAFGEASLVDGYDHLIVEMTCDPKDRHVLATAVRADADVIVTFNLKDFPPTSTEDLGVAVVHPDTFLTSLLAKDPRGVIEALRRGCADLRNPAQTVAEFLASMTATVPIFANLAADQVVVGDVIPASFTALVHADGDEAIAAFGKTGDLADPAQVALLWWAALGTAPDAVRELTFSPPAWGDYGWAIEMLAGKSLASRVIHSVDAPDDVAFMRFIPAVAATSQVFAAHLTTATFLTLVRIPDRTWRVWGLGPALLAAVDVIGNQSS